MTEKNVLNQNQLWDTYPAQYKKFEDYWDGAKKSWSRMIKGIIVTVAGLLAALLILIFLPFNLFTGLLAAFFVAVAGIGLGQYTIANMIYVHNDRDTSILMWAGWSDMGGFDYGQRGYVEKKGG